MVSNAKDDFPLPLTPVNTTSLFLGKLISIFFKLCSRAPITSINESEALFTFGIDFLAAIIKLICQSYG